MICFGQGMSRDGRPAGRWREMRISRAPGDMVEVRPRRGTLATDRTPDAGSRPTMLGSLGLSGKRHVRKSTLWRVNGRAEQSAGKKVIYLLGECSDLDMPDIVAIRIPVNSKAIAMLEELSQWRSASGRRPASSGTVRTTANRPGTGSPTPTDASAPSPGTPSEADRPDPD
jgi:hypothetical protein